MLFRSLDEKCCACVAGKSFPARTRELPAYRPVPPCQRQLCSHDTAPEYQPQAQCQWLLRPSRCVTVSLETVHTTGHRHDLTGCPLGRPRELAGWSWGVNEPIHSLMYADARGEDHIRRPPRPLNESRRSGHLPGMPWILTLQCLKVAYIQ